MNSEEMINVDDINYAVYKIGEWNEKYEVNQIGLSSEIPITKNTLDHVKASMDEIRNAKFESSNKMVNGFVAIAMHLNPKVQDMQLEDLVELEEREYHNILKELDNLELLDEGTQIPLNGEDYLIYKLEKDCHVVKAMPANSHTINYYNNELKKIEDALD